MDMERPGRRKEPPVQSCSRGGLVDAGVFEERICAEVKLGAVRRRREVLCEWARFRGTGRIEDKEAGHSQARAAHFVPQFRANVLRVQCLWIALACLAQVLANDRAALAKVAAPAISRHPSSTRVRWKSARIAAKCALLPKMLQRGASR